MARLSHTFLLAVPLVGLGELASHFYFANKPPGFAEWGPIKERVTTFAPPSAPIIVAPRWAEPMARKALGDAQFPLEHVARADMTRFERAVEISILGEHAPELSGWAEETRLAQGKFLFRLVRNPNYQKVVTNFVDAAHPPFAEVFLTEPRETCRYNAHAKPMSGGLGGNPTFAPQRFECPGGVFFNVGATVIADEEFAPRRCLWSHPPKQGEVVTRFTQVKLGTAILGHSGLYWMVERERKGANITLTVRVDGDEIGKVVHTDGQGWAGFQLPLGPTHENKPNATVEFGVSSPNYRDRHFCFEATSR